MTTAPDIGLRIAKRLADSVGPRRYTMWFDRSARFDYHSADRTLRVAVPSRFVADWIGKHFSEDLHAAAHRELGRDVELDVQVAPDRFAQDTEETRSAATTPPPAAPAADHAPRRAAPPMAGSLHATPLSRLRHKLEDFIVGPSNELAFAAAQRMAEDDAEPGHPLFLHGGCGLGKTHLLQGLCRRLLEQRPDARVLYTTGEQFTNDYITAVRTNKLDTFRRGIRQLDLLAVDDVHFIANKQATQQEFLHSFDQIELGGARVVLASDSHPKLIKQFSEALVSRCVRGLVVQVKPPDGPTRVKLVQALAQRRGMTLQASVAEQLADQGAGSVREIEGLLTKLRAIVSLTRQNGQAVDGPIGHSIVRRLLDHEVGSEPRRPVQFATVLEAVSERLGVPAQEVVGRGRQRTVVLARSLVVHMARLLTPMSYPEIAAAMGRSNHSTVITAAQRVQKQIDASEEVAWATQLEPITLKNLVEELRRQIVRGG